MLSDPEWCQWSNREVAKQCGVGEWLVRQLKEELSACNTQIDQAYARKCGVDEDTLSKVQQRLEAQTQECTAQRQGTTYTISTAGISRRSKKVVSTEKSAPTEAPEAKPTQVLFNPPSSAPSPKDRLGSQVVDVSAEAVEDENLADADQTEQLNGEAAQTETPSQEVDSLVQSGDSDSSYFSKAIDKSLSSVRNRAANSSGLVRRRRSVRR